MSIYSNVPLVNKKTVKDKVGLIRALLSDIPNDLDYDRWMTLIGIIKTEIPDEADGFNLFEEFSSRFDSYTHESCYNKFYNSGIQGDGRATLGSLKHWVKEELGEAFDYAKYQRYYETDGSVTITKSILDKLSKATNTIPNHKLVDVPLIKMPNSMVEPDVALMILFKQGEYRATATHPKECKIIDPYAGETLEQFVSVNPIIQGTKRSQDNCADFRHAVIEFDTISLDEQFSVFSAFELPYEALVYTGNKSIHAWVRIDAKDLAEYKRRTKLLVKLLSDSGYNELNNKAVDPLIHNPTSWVRCAGVVRTAIKPNDNSTGRVQTCLWAERSGGWDEWYNTVYPTYVDEGSIIPDKPIEFVVPEVDSKFKRKFNQLKELLDGDKFLDEIVDILKSSADIPSTLNDAITSFLQSVRKKTKNKLHLTIADVYHTFEPSVLKAGLEYHGDIREALYTACLIADTFEEERKNKNKERVEAEVVSTKGRINQWVDPELIQDIDKSLVFAREQGEDEYTEMLLSIEELFNELDYRTAVLKKNELYKFAGMSGKLLANETKKDDGVFYVYYDELQTFDREAHKFNKVTTYTFPSVVSPFICFVHKDAKGKYKALPLDDNSVGKLLQANQFLSHFNKVDIISEVPVLNCTDDVVSMIKAYDKESQTLVTGDGAGYEFIDVKDAVNNILDLFVDFKFVSQSDLSRAIACLLLPAMCHARLLRGDFRPLAYIDADKQGAGKGTLVHFLTIPYVDSYALVTQDDASIGSIDEKIASAIKSGKNHVVIDNLKPNKKMKELSSSFIEALMTADSISFRCAGERMMELDLRWAMLYVTTNGMPLSKDTAERSLYISIRKQDAGHKYKDYENGIRNYLIQNRPKIMSSIFTILKDYVERGKPLKPTAEGHRFLYSIPAVNYIVTELFGLPDVTSDIRRRNEQKSTKGADIVRTICFCIDSDGLLNSEITHIDMFESLSRHEKAEELDLGLDDLYADESGHTLTNEAKRVIGTKLGVLFSKPYFFGTNKSTHDCFIEEYKISRIYENRTPKYIITKGAKDE